MAETRTRPLWPHTHIWAWPQSRGAWASSRERHALWAGAACAGGAGLGQWRQGWSRGRSAGGLCAVHDPHNCPPCFCPPASSRGEGCFSSQPRLLLAMQGKTAQRGQAPCSWSPVRQREERKLGAQEGAAGVEHTAGLPPLPLSPQDTGGHSTQYEPTRIAVKNPGPSWTGTASHEEGPGQLGTPLSFQER